MRRPRWVSVRLVDHQFANIYRKGGVWPISSGSPNEVQAWLYENRYGWCSSNEDTLSGTYERQPSIEENTLSARIRRLWESVIDLCYNYFIEEDSEVT